MKGRVSLSYTRMIPIMAATPTAILAIAPHTRLELDEGFDELLGEDEELLAEDEELLPDDGEDPLVGDEELPLWLVDIAEVASAAAAVPVLVPEPPAPLSSVLVASALPSSVAVELLSIEVGAYCAT